MGVTRIDETFTPPSIAGPGLEPGHHGPVGPESANHQKPENLRASTCSSICIHRKGIMCLVVTRGGETIVLYQTELRPPRFGAGGIRTRDHELRRL